jgi:heme a synthase
MIMLALTMGSFRFIITLCIVGTYLVIMAGAIVRGTGSGLGCPDWPRCFGQWIPPMDISELPTNYKELYQIAGKTIADFDPFKTWTEYINRLLGVLLGFSIVALFIRSLGLRHRERNLPWFCGGLLLLIIVQGLLGAMVVSTHLKPFIITIHMLLAMVLLFALLYLRKYCADLEDTAIVPPTDNKGLGVVKGLVGLIFIQILLGTQVRQSVDHLVRDTQQASYATVIDELGLIFYIHRSFSIIITAVFIYLLIYFHRWHFNRRAMILTFFGFLCVASNIFTGILLNYGGFPASAQPPHLFFSVLCSGIIYSLYLHLKGSLLDD